MSITNKKIDIIDEFDEISFTNHYVKRSIPAIIKNGVFDWAKSEDFNFDRMKEIVANHTVKSFHSNNLEFTRNPLTGEMTSYLDIPFHDCIDLMKKTKPDDQDFLYLSLHLFKDLPELENHIPLPEYLANKRNLSIRIWIGPKPIHTCVHYDFRNNFFVQLYGTKRFVLYHPKDYHNMYPHPRDSKAFYVGRVDIDKPDLINFPKFKNAIPTEVIVEKGDVLFLPPGWWHKVYTLENSVSVNFWWEIYFRQAIIPAYYPLLKTRLQKDTTSWYKKGEL